MDELDISGKRYISTKRAAREHGYHSDYMGQLIRAKKVMGQKVGRAWYIEEDSLNAYLGKAPAPASSAAAVPAPIAEVAVPAAPAPIAEAAPSAPPAPVELGAAEESAPAVAEEQVPAVIEERAPAFAPEPQLVVEIAMPEPSAERETHEPAADAEEEIREEEQPIAVRIQLQAAEPAYEPAAQKIYYPPLRPSYIEEQDTRIPVRAAAPAEQEAGGLRYAADDACVPQNAGIKQAASASAYAPQPASAPRQAGVFPYISLSLVGVIAILAAAFASNFVSTTIVSEQGKPAIVNRAIHW